MTEKIKNDINNSEHILVRVLGLDNLYLQFKIRKQATLKKLINSYYQKTGKTRDTVRFKFDGKPFTEVNTPADLGLKNGDTIEVYEIQTGGGFRYSCD